MLPLSRSCASSQAIAWTFWRSWAGTSIGVGESQLDQDVYRHVADLGLEAGAAAEQIEYWIGVGRYRAELARIPPSAGVLRRW